MRPALPTYDLNLLRVFALLYEHRSVTRTAELLFISQPSASYALGKLRKLMADPLFLRTPSGLDPTPTATHLYPSVRQAIDSLDAAVSAVASFDPATSERTFRMMLTDLGETALLPPILRRIRDLAPGVRVTVALLQLDLIRDLLVRNEVDAVIGVPRLFDPDLIRDELMRVPYRGLCAVNHPRLGDAPQLSELAAEQSVVISSALGHEHVWHRMNEEGLGAGMTVVLPHYSVLPHVLPDTEYFSVLPEALVPPFSAAGTIRDFALPFALEDAIVSLYTNRRNVMSPAIAWLRSVIREALATYPYSPGMPKGTELDN